MRILLVNACVRQDSRTKILTDYLLDKLSGEVREVNLAQSNLKPLDEATLIRRSELINKGDFNDAMFDLAKDFANADIIVMAAPYWDFSFPSLLKLYIEQINVAKLVFAYSEKGEVISHCKAKKLYYVTTKGGYNSDDFGYGYIKALANVMYGIKDTYLIAAEGLDIFGNDATKIMTAAKQGIDELIKKSVLPE